MSRPRSWVWSKANAYAAGWRAAFGVDPSLPNVALGLSVALHETDAGDSVGWEGEHNWGAVQLRAANADELAVLSAASLDPPPMRRQIVDGVPETFVETTLRVTAGGRAALEASSVAPEPRGALHVDSSPVHGWYWVFFRRFDTDAEGARVFVDTLATHRAACRAVLETADDLATSTAQWSEASALAAAMYASRYFEGVHDPTKPGGKQANIDDYAKAIVAELGACLPALEGWTPGASPPADVIDLATIEGVQSAFNAIGTPGTPLTVDGDPGPKTRAVVKTFQEEQALDADGKVGPHTRTALAFELDAEGMPYVNGDAANVLLGSRHDDTTRQDRRRILSLFRRGRAEGVSPVHLAFVRIVVVMHVGETHRTVRFHHDFAIERDDDVLSGARRVVNARSHRHASDPADGGTDERLRFFARHLLFRLSASLPLHEHPGTPAWQHRGELSTTSQTSFGSPQQLEHAEDVTHAYGAGHAPHVHVMPPAPAAPA